MKKFVFTVVLAVLMTSLSLAQEADTSTIQTETADVQKAVPTEAVKKECSDKKWVLGFKVNSLDLGDLPGMVFMQRKLSDKFHIGTGFSCYYNNYDPGEDYDAVDSTRSYTKRRNWTVGISPEIGYTLPIANLFYGGLALKLEFSRSKSSYNSYNRIEKQQYYYYSYKDESNSFNYGVKIPVFLEKQFRIKKYPVSVGIISDCLTLSGGWNKYMHKSTYESYLSPTPTVHEYESTNISPTDLYIYNPFGNYVKAYFKFYF